MGANTGLLLQVLHSISCSFASATVDPSSRNPPNPISFLLLSSLHAGWFPSQSSSSACPSLTAVDSAFSLFLFQSCVPPSSVSPYLQGLGPSFSPGSLPSFHSPHLLFLIFLLQLFPQHGPAFLLNAAPCPQFLIPFFVSVHFGTLLTFILVQLHVESLCSGLKHIQNGNKFWGI